MNRPPLLAQLVRRRLRRGAPPAAAFDIVFREAREGRAGGLVGGIRWNPKAQRYDEIPAKELA